MYRLVGIWLVSTGAVLMGLGSLGWASMCIDGGCLAFSGACPTDPMNAKFCTLPPADPCPGGAPATCACMQTARGCKCCMKQ